MTKQFDNDQVAVLQQIIHEHEHGLDIGTRETFAPRQKPLNYDELAAVRRMIVVHTAAEVGKKMADAAAKYTDGLLDQFLPPQPKMSTLLADAATLIANAMLIRPDESPDRPLFMGQNWRLLYDQLRTRAHTLRKLDQ